MLFQALAAAAAGLFAHQLLFIHGEWHLRAPYVIIFHVFITLSLIWIKVYSYGRDLLESALLIGTLLASYLSSLFLSIAIYRVFFHRLRHFPGPPLAAVSKLWHVWKCRDSRNHHVLDECHKRYGSLVRTGPSELTMFLPNAFEIMDGTGNRNSRSDWYDLIYPRVSTIFTRDPILHGRRRRLWDQALSTKALAGYKSRILGMIDSLEEIVASRCEEPTNVKDLVYWFTFDSMGDFAFSDDFGQLRNRKWAEPVLKLRSAISLLGPFSPAIWIPRIAFTFIPGVWRVKHWFQMLKFADQCMKKRIETTPKDRDVASYFIENQDLSSTPKMRDLWLSGDTATLVVAGSDTTSSSLVSLFYFLARFPEHQEKIFEELQSIDTTDYNDLAKLSHLNGAINETMRLLPSVLTFSFRDTPPAGIMIDKTWIPGNVKLCAPRYTIGRLDIAFGKPHEYIPERWYSRPELIKDKRAFAPFGIGRMGCVGKTLALIEMRLLTARLISNYKFRFAPDEGNGESFERDLKDQLAAQPRRLNVVFQRR